MSTIKDLKRRMNKSCSQPFHENFKDESPLLLFVFAIIVGAFILRRKRSHYTTANAIVRGDDDRFDEVNQGYDYEGNYIEMDNPRRCSYY